MSLSRRRFLGGSLATAAGLAAAPALFRAALAEPTAATTSGPYGPLQAADANGIRLPAGFASRVLAESEQVVAGTGYLWHHAPDGGATFAVPDGGWVYVSNSEVPSATGGGASALRFDANGEIDDAYRILAGTSLNCAGGATPWGTWLSCEEHDAGMVWECDPTRPGTGLPRPALGLFAHEAVAVDDSGWLYLTEDEPDGRFYRFRPATAGDLSAGVLEAAAVGHNGHVSWIEVDARVPQSHARDNRTTPFDGGEGCYHHRGVVYLTTKGDNRVWAYRVRQERINVVYEPGPGLPLRGVDNVTVSQDGHVLVAEDGDDMQICVLADDGVFPLLQIEGHEGSEICGPAFSPDGSRLYFSSQRGRPGPLQPLADATGQNDPTRFGITYEVTGFRA